MDLLDEPSEESGLKVFFNPFAFDIETNNRFLQLGYEPTPMRVPDTKEDLRGR